MARLIHDGMTYPGSASMLNTYVNPDTIDAWRDIFEGWDIDLDRQIRM